MTTPRVHGNPLEMNERKSVELLVTGVAETELKSRHLEMAKFIGVGIKC